MVTRFQMGNNLLFVAVLGVSLLGGTVNLIGQAAEETGGQETVTAPAESGTPLAHEEIPAEGRFSSLTEKEPETLAEKAMAFLDKTSLLPIFAKGGPIMWPLLIASIFAQGTVIERLFFIFNQQRHRDLSAVEKIFAAVEKGDTDFAIRASNASRYYVARTLGYALTHQEKSLESALLFAQEQELKCFRRGIPMLDTVITLAPLLGLLGTVTGMMGSFSLIGGELSAPGAITGGIAEALIATAFGLGIAITALIPFNFINTKAEEARLEMESAATRLELLLHRAPSETSLAAAF